MSCVSNANENAVSNVAAQATTASNFGAGFFERHAEEIRDMFAHYSKVQVGRWNVDSSTFRKVMAFVDAVNAAAYDVDSVGSNPVERYVFFAGLKELFFAPRDARFGTRLSSPNIIVANSTVISASLSRSEFNAAVDDICGVMRSALTTETLDREGLKGDFSILVGRPLVVYEDGRFSCFCPFEPEDMKAPVVVDASIKRLLYNESKWVVSEGELFERWIEALRLKLSH